MTEPEPGLKPQRRSRLVAMTPSEVDVFLTTERTCRLASVGRDGAPHVSPLWFVWHDGALWISSLVRSQRWTDIVVEPRVAVVVDSGVAYNELRGVELDGIADVVGDVPRTGATVEELAEPERLLSRKYRGTDAYVPDGKHAFLRIRPTKIVSWDFRKIPT